MENQHRMITGYRDLTIEEIGVMNTIKEYADDIGVFVENLAASVGGSLGVDPDPRWVAIARTHLQEGFMALTRAVAKPESF